MDEITTIKFTTEKSYNYKVKQVYHVIFHRFIPWIKYKFGRMKRATILNYLRARDLHRKIRGMNPTLHLTWFGISTASILLTIVVLSTTIATPAKASSNKYSIFSSKPLILGIASERIFGNDSRAAVLDEVFSAYNCPLTGLGATFVSEADKNNIPYWLVAAVSFQESSCGKMTPEKEGIESYNAWGWGVWGDNVSNFKDWEEGIKVVSKYMNEKFYSKGITEPCDIMKTYTPPSKGSWCNGVNYFKDVIVHYRSPLL